MISAISEIDALGNELNAEEIEKRDKEIQQEIMKALYSHNLTVGQAIHLLGQIKNNLSNSLYSFAFDDYFGNV